MAEPLLTFHQYKHGNFPGNCGIRTAFRLSGSYIDPDQAAKEYEAAKEHGQLSKIPIKQGQRSIKGMLDALHGVSKQTGYNRPYPLHWAFAEVLEAVYGKTKAALIISDTVKGKGDGHKGPFSPRSFARWLMHNRAYSGVKKTVEKQVTSNIVRPMTIWILTHNLTRCEDFLERLREEIRGTLESENKNPDLLAQIEAVELEKRRIHEGMDRQWQESGLNFTEPEPQPRARARARPRRPGEFVRVTRQGPGLDQQSFAQARAILDEANVPRPNRVVFDEMVQNVPETEAWNPHPVQEETWAVNDDEIPEEPQDVEGDF